MSAARRVAVLRWSVAVIGLLILIASLAAFGLWWIARSEAGLQWALEQAVSASGGRLSLEGVSGSLTGEVRIRRLAFRNETLRVEAHRVLAAPRLSALLDAALTLRLLRADEIDVYAKPSDTPARPPNSLALPLVLRIEQAETALLRIVRGDRTIMIESIRLRYEADQERHRLMQLRAATPWGMLGLDGTLDAQAPFALHAVGTLAQQALRVQARAQGPLAQFDLNADAQAQAGRAHAQAQVTPFAQPVIAMLAAQGESIDLAAIRSGWPHSALRFDATLRREGESFQGHATIENRNTDTPGRIRLPAGTLQARFATDFQQTVDLDANAALGDNRLSARGRIGRAGERLQWTLTASRLDQLGIPVAGRVEGHGQLTGTWQQPLLQFVVAAAQLQVPGDIAVERLDGQGSVGPALDAPFNLVLDARGLAVKQFRFASCSVKTRGRVRQHDASVAISGATIDASARLSGGLRDHSWAGRLLALTDRGRYGLALVAPTDMELGAQHVRLGAAELHFAAGSAKLRELDWQPDRLKTDGSFIELPAQWLIDAAGLAGRAGATLRLNGAWSLAATPRLQGSVQLARAAGDVSVTTPKVVVLGIQTLEGTAQFSDGRMQAEASLVSRFGTLHAEAQLAPTVGAAGLGFDASSALALRAQVELADLRPTAALFTDLRLKGSLAARIEGNGTLGAPNLAGTIAGDNLSFALPPYGVYLEDGSLRARLAGERIAVDRFSIRGGDGRLSASGLLPLRPVEGGTRLAWQAQQFRIANRPDLRLVLSGSGSAGFEQGRIQFAGSVRADRGDIQLARSSLPKLGEDVVVRGRPELRRTPPHAPLQLDLDADLGDDFSLRGEGFAGKLAGRVHLTTDADGALLAEGRIHTQKANFLAYGQQLEVDSGQLIFSGPIDNPALQATAWRRNQAVQAGVELSGTAKTPRVKLVSDPQVPDEEKLSWLVLGRAPGDASGADLALLQSAAGAMLSHGGGSGAPLEQRLARRVGLDELTVRSSEEIASQVIAVGKRLSDRLYLVYERGIGAAAQNLVRLDWTLTRRLSLRAETGSTSGGGLYYRHSWD